jgi:hypothetical protein
LKRDIKKIKISINRTKRQKNITTLSASRLRNKANLIASHNSNQQHPQIPQKTTASNRTGKIQRPQCRQLAERLRQPPSYFSANAVHCKLTQKQSKPHCIAQFQPTTPSNPSKNTNASNRTGKIKLLQCRQLAERLHQPPCSFSANAVPCKPTQKQSKPHCIAQFQPTTPSNPSKNNCLKPYRQDPAPAVPSACQEAPPTSLLLQRPSCSLQADSETKQTSLHCTIPTNTTLKSLKKNNCLKPYRKDKASAVPSACRAAPPTSLLLQRQTRSLQDSETKQTSLHRTIPTNTTLKSLKKNKCLKPYRKDKAPAVPSACQEAPPTSLLLQRQTRSLQADSETKQTSLHRTISTNNTLKSLKKHKCLKPYRKDKASAVPSACQEAPPTSLLLQRQTRSLQAD